MERSQVDAPLETRSPAASEETLFVPTIRGGSNSRALKVARLTTLACLLLASQAFTAYMVFNQKEQIHTLQKESEDTRKQLTPRARGNAPPFPELGPVQTHMPMNGMPMHADDGAELAKTPLTKRGDIATVSVEKQVKDLLQKSQLPQFNKTFLANLQSLKKQMEETEWKGFESWMRQWLIFHVAQEKPPVLPTPQPDTVVKTKCQTEADSGRGFLAPQCDEQGGYNTVQCWHRTGICWCVDESGTPIEGTAIRDIPDCQRALDHLMASPR